MMNFVPESVSSECESVPAGIRIFKSSYKPLITDLLLSKAAVVDRLYHTFILHHHHHHHHKSLLCQQLLLVIVRIYKEVKNNIETGIDRQKNGNIVHPYYQ